MLLMWQDSEFGCFHSSSPTPASHSHSFWAWGWEVGVFSSEESLLCGCWAGGDAQGCQAILAKTSKHAGTLLWVELCPVPPYPPCQC